MIPRNLQVAANYLKLINFFVKPVDLYLLKQGGHRTFFGTFLTMGIISVLMVVFISIVTSFITHDNPTLLTNQAYSKQQPPIYLSQKNFTMTISSQNYDLKQAYNATMSLVSQSYQDKKIITRQTLPLISCESQNTLSEYFTTSNLLQYCIDWDQLPVLILEGSLDSDHYKFIEISINQCEETKCFPIESDEIIIKTLSTYADTMNYQNPHQLYGRTFRNVVNQYYTKRLNGIFQITEVKQDQGYILQNLDVTKSLSITNLYENFDSQDEKVYATYSFYLDNISQIYQISYPKVQQSLSDFGGLCEIFIIAALIVVTPLNGLSYKVTLLNELFNFNLLEQQNDNPDQKVHPQSNAKQRLKSIKLKTSQLERINRQANTSIKNSEHNSQKLIITALQESIRRFFEERNTKLKLNFCDYFPCVRGKKQQLITYSMGKINNALDITYIIKKLQEIDKLKMILLSTDQIKLFDFLPKPNIDLQDSKQVSYFSILKPEQTELDKAIEAQTAFNNLVKQKEDKLNKQLIAQLDDDIIQLFKINMKKEVKSLTNFSPVTNFISDLPSRMPQIDQNSDSISESESSPSINSIKRVNI